MGQESGKWVILVASTWIQASTGTNFDFSSYSTDLKSVLGISQVELNYLSVASDMGKVFGWCSGVSLLHFPLWLVMFAAAVMGLFGYGLQWLVIHGFISLPYFLVFLLCLLAGCSICWFNTVCYVLCIKNFTANRPLALSLSISFNGVSAALYNLIVKAIDSSDETLYLLLNAIVPLITSVAALAPILRQPPPPETLPADAVRFDSIIFIYLNIVAVFTGLYLLFLNSASSNASVACILLAGAIFLLVLPLVTPGITYARDWAAQTLSSRFHLEGSSFNLVDVDDLEVHKELMESEGSNSTSVLDGNMHGTTGKEGCCANFIKKDQLATLGEEHPAKQVMRRRDFWLYYVAYLCGGTIGLVYSNNLGQISQSLGFSSKTTSFVTVYSACSFFGRLLSAAPDFLRNKVYFARTGWLALALVPTPFAFLCLVISGSQPALVAATAMIGLSSGFIFAAAVSVTSELFGPNSAGVNHNILITNIPVGSLLYGLVAALFYDANVGNLSKVVLVGESMVCMGRDCYFNTFILWGCISLLGLASSFLLFLRTRQAYDRVQMSRNMTDFT
ncbi:protein NUCLEAR FUSION DEFECTIVE 4-like [Diospyros lotus]|uniref:protein NUCLEAR FUSION DEFECTIVE 4-like n=1 Tax=Diospyros lotus TaxID=55363 RepID=UPI00224FF8C1|nr:protein NUCLEAR FUSION DEFECTIVE 4-like [Diospyros lotus]